MVNKSAWCKPFVCVYRMCVCVYVWGWNVCEYLSIFLYNIMYTRIREVRSTCEVTSTKTTSSVRDIGENSPIYKCVCVCVCVRRVCVCVWREALPRITARTSCQEERLQAAHDTRVVVYPTVNHRPKDFRSLACESVCRWFVCAGVHVWVRARWPLWSSSNVVCLCVWIMSLKPYTRHGTRRRRGLPEVLYVLLLFLPR